MNKLNFSTGDIIENRYLILDKFRGSMGLAYLVENLDPEPKLPSRLIMKTFLPGIQRESSLQQFLKEAKIWINVAPFKNVVHAYKVELIQDNPVIFAEYVAPGLLPNVLTEWIHFRLTNLEMSLFFIVQLLDGLWYSYQDDIELHGDLKPSNLLINQDLDLKINDWGFAIPSNKNMALDEYQAWFSRYHGASDYLAPEAKSATPLLSRAVDGYALGVLLGEMLTGERFQAGISTDLVKQKISPVCFGVDTPVIESLASVIAGLLCLDPASRTDFYEQYSRTLADLFSEVSEINVIDDSDAIIISPMPPGHSDRVNQSKSVLNQFKNHPKDK